MSNQFIPNEILLQIFDLLKRNDLYSSIFVCKSWHMTAIRLYYEVYEVNEDRIKFGQLFKYGYLTKKLFWDESSLLGPDRDNLRNEEFLLMLSYVPNIKILDLSYSPHDDAYMDMLGDDTIADIYLQHIEEIVLSGQESLYFLACYNFRKSIKRLTLYEYDYLIQDGVNIFLHYLPDFTCLTDLIFYNSQKPDLTLFDILLYCKNLSYLEYGSSYPVPLRAKDQVGTTNNKYLKRLTLELPLDATPYLDYIRSLHHLDSLELNIKENVYEWFQKVDSFAEDLKRFKNIRIRHLIHDNREASSALQMKAFYNFLLKLKGETNLQYNATFSGRGKLKDPIIDIQDRKMKFTYYMMKEDPFPFIDEQGIIKTLIFDIFVTTFPSSLLAYAKTCSHLETLCIYSDDVLLEATKTKICIDRFDLSQIIFDQLYSYLPNAESINCRKTLSYTTLLQNISMDLTNFKYLQTFIFDIKHLKICGYDFVFVKLHFGDTSCYRRIYDKKGHYQPVTGDFALGSTANTSIVTFKFHSRLTEITFNTPDDIKIGPPVYSDLDTVTQDLSV